MNLLKKHGKIGAILLLGIILGSMMITPAEGHPQPLIIGGSSGTLSVCIGTIPSNGSVKIASRVISSTALMEYSPTGSCPAGESAVQWNNYVRTVLVSPISGGTAIQNGAVLIAAMATITTATNINPWLLKIEPGLYDLNGGSLTMQPYVDIEGSGEDTTVISSTVASATIGTLIAASNSEARFLTLMNSGTANVQMAVYMPSAVTNITFSHLTIIVSGGSNNYGIFTNTGTLTVENSNIMASTGNSNYPIYITTGVTTTVKNSTITASAGSNTNIGVYNFKGTLTMENSNVTASAGFNAYGIASRGTTTVRDSTISATGATNSYGFFFVTGTSQVGASGLGGTTAASSAGLTLCPDSYNTITFAPLNASCQ